MRRLRPSPAIVIAGLLGGAATASGVALTATSGWLIVRASERPVILTLLTAIVAVRAFGIARPYLRYVERLRSHDAAMSDLADERQSVYRALIPLTPARLGRRARSDVLAGVVDDLTDTVEAQVRVTVPVLSSLVAGLVATTLAAALFPPVGLVLALLLLVVGLGCWLAAGLESRGRDEILAARAEVLRVSDLVARQADELRAVGGEHTASRWLAGAHAELREHVGRQSRGRALVAALILLATAAACVAAALLTWGSGLDGPVRALLVVLPVAVGDALAPLADAMRTLARAEGSRDRLAKLLAQAPAVTDAGCRDRARAVAPGDSGRRGAAPELRLQGVSASWTDARVDLPPMDVTIRSGERLAIIGANGSGKSTLLALLARHLDPASGQYTIGGTDVRRISLTDARAHFAVLDDEPHVFAASLRANLALAAPNASDAELLAALREAGLADWYARLPEGLDTPLGAGARGLSGGERTRLGLARALASRRPILLLDEPLAHLDHATANGVLQDLSRIPRTTTLIIMSHCLEGLDLFDTVLDLTARAGPRPDSDIDTPPVIPSLAPQEQ